MNITINRPINPNFQALHLSSYRKCHREIGDFNRSDYKRLKHSLSECAKDVEIYVSPSQNSLSSGFDVEIKKLGEKPGFWDLSDSIKFNVQRNSAKHGLVNDTITGTQRIVREYIKHDFSGDLYIPDKGELPEAIDMATSRLKELAKAKRVNIFISPEHSMLLKSSNPTYHICTQKPGLSNFHDEKQPKIIRTSYSDIFVYPNTYGYDPFHYKSVVAKGDWTTKSVADEIVRAANAICN